MVQELMQMEDIQSAAANQNAAGDGSTQAVVVPGAGFITPHNAGGAQDFFLSNADFVPYNPAELDCRGCTVLRGIQHRSDVMYIHFRLHGHAPGIIGHALATITRAYEQGQAPTTSHLYMGLLHRTHDWIETFIGALVQTLRGYPNGQTRDAVSTFAAAVCSNPPPPPVNPGPYTASLVLGGLQQILAPIPAVQSAVAPPAVSTLPLPPPAPGVYALGSNAAAAAGVGINTQSQHRRMQLETIMSEAMVMNKDDAARSLNIGPGTDRLCRKNKLARWPAKTIQSYDRQIKDAEKKSTTSPDLIKLRRKIDELKAKKAVIWELLMKVLDDIISTEHPTKSGNNNRRDPPPPGAGASALPVA
ncbi:hypothetical protein E2562_033622 [Oryza meyeriana var. granulata]|uniref:RWP-RK domain-containing protein n=1 Tax=Oryza meyeriana var. granulata TaxID=110450 RepID=A0A6G1FEX8_9ORYZ|nr:hypothetical protein E2562_033622 [Oryza meyeriana var. granulata]